MTPKTKQTPATYKVFSALRIQRMMTPIEYKAFCQRYENTIAGRTSQVELSERERNAHRELSGGRITVAQYAKALGINSIAKAAAHYGRVHFSLQATKYQGEIE